MTSKDEILIDEAARQSFPASDPPAWSAMHAGFPSHAVRRIETPRELRAILRRDVESLTLERRDRVHAVAELVTTAFVDTHRHAIRSPLLARPGIENVETVIRGAASGGEVVIATRYEGAAGVASGVAVLLGLARVLAGQQFHHTVRLVAFADAGARGYAKRLRSQGIHVSAALSIGSIGFERDHGGPSLPFPLRALARRVIPAAWQGDLVAFVGDRASRALAEEACIAFHTAATVEARVLGVPTFLPYVSSSNPYAFAREGFSSVLLTDKGPLHRRGHLAGADLTDALDYDLMADVVFGLAAVVRRLAGAD